MNIGSIDFISSLPEGLICHILSFLPTKHAALTSLLSKRWRYVFAFVPNLDFDDKIYGSYEMSQQKRQEMRTNFQLFVNRVMALQGNASVNKFSLRCGIRVDRSSLDLDLDRWISYVLERGVIDLDLDIPMEHGYPLPCEVLMSKTLVKLKVVGAIVVITEMGEVFLPKLKTLHLDDGVSLENGAAFTRLISACPALEELVMIDVMFFYTRELFVVSNPNLKRLNICFDYDTTGECPNSVSFDTPNLVCLEYTDTVAIKYQKVNFDSLVEARLDLQMRPYKNGPEGDSTDLLMGICNVKILYVSSTTLEVLALCCKAIPIFSNLIHLTIDTDKNVEWESLPKLLDNCPNLQTLVFKGLHEKDTNHCKPWECTRTCLASSPVKLLKVLKFGEITNYEGDEIDKQKEVIKYFLETMPNLEQVMIYYDTSIDDDDDDPSILSTELQMLEKVASSKCKIQVISDNISFS